MYSILLLIIIALFMLSAFFSASETALTSLSKYRIKKLLVLQKKSSRIIMRWMSAPQYLLVTILVGNTITNISISVIATIIAIKLFSGLMARSITEFITWLLITFLIVFFGEIIPKMYSRNNPEKVVNRIIQPLGFISDLVMPLVKPFILVINRVVPGTGTSFLTTGRMTSLTVEELSNIIKDSGRKGIIHGDTTTMLEGILKLDKLKASSIMVPFNKIDSIDVSDIKKNQDKVIARLIETGHSRIPVYSGDKSRIDGIILIKDIPTADSLENVIRPAYFVRADKKVSELLQEFQQGAYHCAVVTDARNKPKGFVTLEDILEEIIGEVLDQYDLSKISDKEELQ